MSVTDDIKARLDIVSYIGQYVPLKKAGRSYKAPCPFHSESTPSFVVNEDYQSWRCFGACSEGGDIFSFAMKYHGWDFKEALTELGNQAGVEVRERTPEQQQRAERADYLRGLLNEVAETYHRKLYDQDDTGAAEALRYAQVARGLSDETIRAFGVGYAPTGWANILSHLTELGYTEDDAIEAGVALRSDRTGTVYDRFRNRLMVPIRDPKGRVVGFGGRVLDPEDSPKYMNTPQTAVFDKSNLLFGLDLAKQSIRDSETAVIVEGYMDAITAYQAGFTNVVAQMGTAMTEQQLELIVPKHAKRIVLALDSDAAGQNATRRGLEVAREALASDYTGRLKADIRVLQIPDAKDPDDLIREEPERWRQLVSNALPVAEFVIELEMADLPAEPTLQDREDVARRLAPILTATENDLFQKENLQKLARRLIIPETDLFRIAEEVRQEEAKRQHYRAKRQQRQQREKNEPPPDSTDEGPPPITDYGDLPPDDDEPPPLHHNGVQAAKPTSTNRQPSRNTAATRIEAYFLNQLFTLPSVYYHVNGRLHAIANGDPALLAGPMAPLGEPDFTNPGLRSLMGVFLQALEQDEMDPIEYVFAEAAGSLGSELNLVTTNHVEQKLADPNAVNPVDLRRIQEKLQRGGVKMDPTRDLVVQALRLRCRKIERERGELRLIQANANAERDTDGEALCIQKIDQLTRAIHLLKAEEEQLSRMF